MLPHWDSLLVAYLGYYLLGTLGGIYAEAVLDWLRRQRWLVGAAMAGLLGYLMLDLVQDGFTHYSESVDIFRPALMLYALAGSGMLLACAGQITSAGGTACTWLLAISQNSYAIYLAHPLVLYLVEPYLLSYVQRYSPMLSGPLIVVGALVPHELSLLLRSTPLGTLAAGSGLLATAQPRRQPQTRVAGAARFAR